jgi:hypothetical protein
MNQAHEISLRLPWICATVVGLAIPHAANGDTSAVTGGSYVAQRVPSPRNPRRLIEMYTALSSSAGTTTNRSPADFECR